MKRTRFLILAHAIAFLPLLGGCLFSNHDEGRISEENRGKAGLKLTLSTRALAKGSAFTPLAIDSIEIRVIADDMAPMRFAFSGSALALNLEDIPAGASRVLSAQLFRKGSLLYSGRGTYSLLRESHSEISLKCDPQFSRVSTRFHFPMGLTVPIVDGMLKVSGRTGEFSAKLFKQGEFGSFTIESLPGDARYNVSLVLIDSMGKSRFEAKRDTVFLPMGEESKWDLSLLPMQAEAGLALKLSSVKTLSVAPVFPSGKRKPIKNGEVVISEFYAVPAEKDSGTAGEWFELFNRTGDTLNLSGCRISKDRTTGVTRSLMFDSTQIILPGQAVVFGRTAASAAVHYSDFTMVNTASSLLLLCKNDSLVLDSLKYSSSPVDSGIPGGTVLPVKDGWVTTLASDLLGNRTSAESWCLTHMAYGIDALSGIGISTPGRIESCKE